MLLRNKGDRLLYNVTTETSLAFVIFAQLVPQGGQSKPIGDAIDFCMTYDSLERFNEDWEDVGD